MWKRTPAPARGDVLRRVGDLLVERKEESPTLMTREMGKPLAETRGDVQEGIDTAYYAATEGRRMFGKTVPSELRNKWAMSFRRPIGVAGLITPFNFPLAIPTWKSFPALVCGNAVIFKPAEDVPHTGHVLVEILLEAGLPPEVIQLVHGLGEAVGAAIVAHPDVPVISFTGSTDHRRDRRRDVRPHAQAALARDGRQERDDRDGRRRSRSRARRRALGRVRHHRTALHRDEPPDRAARRARHVARPCSPRARHRSSSATAARRAPKSARSSTTNRARRWSATSRSARASRRRSCMRRRARDGRGPRARLLLPADDLRRREGGIASRAGGDLRPGAVGDQGEGRRRGDRGEQRCANTGCRHRSTRGM